MESPGTDAAVPPVRSLGIIWRIRLVIQHLEPGVSYLSREEGHGLLKPCRWDEAVDPNSFDPQRQWAAFRENRTPWKRKSRGKPFWEGDRPGGMSTGGDMGDSRIVPQGWRGRSGAATTRATTSREQNRTAEREWQQQPFHRSSPSSSTSRQHCTPQHNFDLRGNRGTRPMCVPSLSAGEVVPALDEK